SFTNFLSKKKKKKASLNIFASAPHIRISPSLSYALPYLCPPIFYIQSSFAASSWVFSAVRAHHWVLSTATAHLWVFSATAAPLWVLTSIVSFIWVWVEERLRIYGLGL
ncbi:hypothetical protein PanWU01x14_019580, partial [Parasponia andersonii]